MSIFIPVDHPPFTKRIERSEFMPQEQDMEILECSTVSHSRIGRSLSAFNLKFTTPSERMISVESAYQGSKVFQKGGPFQDLYDKASSVAKQDQRIRSHGRIIGFQFFSRKMPCMPLNAFYNWLYLSTLIRVHTDAPGLLKKYDGFSDSFFNPQKGRSCQAEAVSMIKGLKSHGLWNIDFFKDWREFYKMTETVVKGEEIK